MRYWMLFALLSAGCLALAYIAGTATEPTHNLMCALAKSDAEEWIAGGCP